MTLFGAAALTYTVILLGYIAIWSGGWAFDEFGSSGLGLFTLAMVGLLHKPASEAASSARSVGKEKWEDLGKKHRRSRFVLFWGVLLLAVAFCPWQLRIASELKVLPKSRATVRAPADGRIARIAFSEGEQVRKGDLLLEYDSKLLIYITVSIVTALHELAHAVTCRHFGGRVQDMGFPLMYFVPCFYCNVSDTYLFKEKRQRLWVIFAGGFFELFIWATAVLAWRLVAPEAFLSRVFFIIVAVGAIKTFFNFNPLIKLDGYYLLADYLGIANLRKEALSGLGRFFRRFVLNLSIEPPRPELAGRNILSLRGDSKLSTLKIVSRLKTKLSRFVSATPTAAATVPIITATKPGVRHHLTFG